jgi:hypothetical protein
VEKRKDAISILVEINDKDMINPLLLHLKEEDVLEIKDLVIQGISQTGKKRAIIAIMNTLKEIGDRDLKLRALSFLQTLFGDNPTTSSPRSKRSKKTRHHEKDRRTAESVGGEAQRLYLTPASLEFTEVAKRGEKREKIAAGFRSLQNPAAFSSRRSGGRETNSFFPYPEKVISSYPPL